MPNNIHLSVANPAINSGKINHVSFIYLCYFCRIIFEVMAIEGRKDILRHKEGTEMPLSMN